MTDTLRFTILGCGSSGGVPRLGGNWGDCDPNNPRNLRRRCSILVERIGDIGTTRLLIDTSPDMRMQLLDANVSTLDAVVYTHEHADHLHGLDDLRMIVINRRERLPVYATGTAKTDIMNRFNYAFETPAGSDYPPILEMRDLTDHLTIAGAGGQIAIDSFDVPHGNINVRALRINDLLYTPDVSSLPNQTRLMEGLSCWVIDALRYKPHPSHINVETALSWIEKFTPKRAILTNLHIDLDYAVLDAETPDYVTPAHDGLIIEYSI